MVRCSTASGVWCNSCTVKSTGTTVKCVLFVLTLTGLLPIIIACVENKPYSIHFLFVPSLVKSF